MATESVRSQPTQAASIAQASKRTEQRPPPQANAEAAASQRAAEQASRPTTNTRGEVLGQRLNVTA